MNKAERLNQELIFLSNKSIFHINDLVSEFQISKRTALRDITDLEDMGLSFYTENGRYGGFHIVNRQLLIPVTFNLEEINAIFFALNALSSMSATPFEKPYKHISDKLMATLPKIQQQAVVKLQKSVQYYKIPSISAPTDLNIILQSILEETALDLTFHSNRQTIQVFDLLYRHGIWFCNIYNFDGQKWATYRCDQMEHCSLNRTHKTLTHEELKQIQDNYERNYHNIPFECDLTPLGVELFQKNNYPNMKLKQVNGQYYLYGGYNQEEFDYMVQYLLSLGNNVKINYPKELKDSYLQELQKIIDQY
ncbi:MAG TPA: WYL domain-containing protein [Candidatus Companilactobacillus pullicola]|uniref:WYL domain-containing protein n=1 Tax=Candidatus Companilactobacillus pullicola TaxID=2838523 RepID=A0A9D2CM05_9LACO|nr:WYL domain-containing protein [Candidatus Companilactobacillus pullicola]